MSGVSKSQISQLCAETVERIATFLKRSLEGDWPRLWPPHAAGAGGSM
jgi:transposase-like protein